MAGEQKPQEATKPATNELKSSTSSMPQLKLINHETPEQLEKRLLASPASRAWARVGIRHHYGINVAIFGIKTPVSSGVGEYLDLIPLVDFCQMNGFDIIQLLPINDVNTDNSPFSPISSFSLNIWNISLTQLPHVDKQTGPMGTLLHNLNNLNKSERVQWKEVKEGKMSWLRQYFELEETQALLQTPDFEAFLTKNTYWIEGYAIFSLLKHRNSFKYWGDWKESQVMDAEAQEMKVNGKMDQTPTYKRLVQENAKEIKFFQLLQFLAYQQMSKVRDYANSKQIHLKGDIPFLCSKDSADVWLNRNLFFTNWSAGAPPDMYAKEGQDWGLPLYNWPEMEKEGYTWWKNRLLVASQYFSLYRVDHIVGFFRVWGVPKGKKPFEGGYQPEDKRLWIPAGEKVLRVLLETSDMLPIGEDLGTVPPEVRISLQKLGICGTKVIRWERLWEKKYEGQPFIAIEDYNSDSMTTVSTHDSETLPLWWLQKQNEARAFCGFKKWPYKVEELKGGQPPAKNELYNKMIPTEYLEAVLRDSHHSASLFHINLLSEYLALEPPTEDGHGLVHRDPLLERINIPGTVQDANWSYRMLPTIQDVIINSDLRNRIEKLRISPKDAPKIEAKKVDVVAPSVHPFIPLPRKLRVFPGKPYPLGATWDGAGVNFAIFSENGTKCELCLFDASTATSESHRIEMPEYDDFVFHCYLPDVRPGQLYGFRIYGPWDPQNGHRFNHTKVLIDPYAKAIGRDLIWDDSMFPYNMYEDSADRHMSMNTDDNAAYCALAAVVDTAFTWGNDSPPNVPWHKTVIYEAHVKSLTYLHPEIPEDIRGTYSALCFEPVIKHLKKLGITAIELMPIHHHVDEKFLLDKGMKNYWGYNTLSFFAPDLRYSASPDVLSAVQEFKTMVRVLHSHNIEVILDVVYNHTAEGNHYGPMFNFKGCDNKAYYKLVEGDEKYFFDFTGCGNTLNVRHPRVLQLIMDSLRYWIEEMHVDGFRFDLASALARTFYEVDRLGAFFDIIHQDPVISRVKLIAEPWDLGNGGYQVGNFPVLWTEWNGMFRDTVRNFWNGKGISIGEIATRITGSSDLYSIDTGRSPVASINFVTCHDGFNLVDLVSYNEKHNDANGENNNDGANDNMSWNHGTEGPTDNEGIKEFRWRQRANIIATMMLSLGVPMLLGGDELSKTQLGNNNTYCQDSELTWFEWNSTESDPDKEDFLEFVQKMIAFRHSQPVLQRRRHFQGRVRGERDIIWYLANGKEPTPDDWSNTMNQCIGYIMEGSAINELSSEGKKIIGDTILVIVNAAFSNVNFRIPYHKSNKPWSLIISTDRTLESRFGHLWQGGEDFNVKDHSISVFQLYIPKTRLRAGSTV